MNPTFPLGSDPQRLARRLRRAVEHANSKVRRYGSRAESDALAGLIWMLGELAAELELHCSYCGRRAQEGESLSPLGAGEGRPEPMWRACVGCALALSVEKAAYAAEVATNE